MISGERGPVSGLALAIPTDQDAGCSRKAFPEECFFRYGAGIH